LQENKNYIGVSNVKAAYTLRLKLKALAFRDKGYIGKILSEELMEGAEPIAALEKQLLNQHCIIETALDYLKHHYQIWHTRHYSIINAQSHLLAVLVAYTIEPLKISVLSYFLQLIFTSCFMLHFWWANYCYFFSIFIGQSHKQILT